VIFAAPDVPQREFLRQLAQVVAAPGLTTGHTLYAAKDDLALFASRELHDNPRAGICPPVTVAPNLETVDVSQYNLSTLGHGYCFNVGPVLEDISVVLHGGKFRLRSRAAGGGHWILG
jgi:esterase/lipase superfamily enzyme